MTVYMTADTRLPSYLPYPRFLLETELSHTAKLVYTVLLDRACLSRQHGWLDSQGHIYQVFPIDAIAKAVCRSTMAVKTALRELDQAGLVERRRAGMAQPSRIYLKIPEEAVEGKKPIPMKERNLSSIQKENFPCEGKKPIPHMERNLSTNQLKSNLIKQPEGRKHPLGRYANIFLSLQELEELQQEFPAILESYIERLSAYMASTGKAYRNHAATIRRWIADDSSKQAPIQRNYTVSEEETI